MHWAGFGRTWIGVVLMASVTSLPELITVLGLTYRAEKKRLWPAWDSIGMAAVYLVNLLLLFALRR